MTLAAPLYLLALLPWAGVVLYLLWGRRRRANVPFLELWRVEVEGRPVRRRAAPPPAALAFAILAMLLAVLAAGRPRMHGPGLGGGPGFAVVLDRGVSMSARGLGDLRFREAADEARAALAASVGSTHPLQVSIVPPAAPNDSPRRTDVSGWTDYHSLPPTAADTRQALRAAVRSRLAKTDQPVLVVSDQPLGFDDERLIQVPPTSAVRNAGIVHVAARERPVPQVMVRVRNAGAAAGPATIRVTSGGQSAEQSVALLMSGEADAFVDLPRLGPTVRAELLADDDQPADNTAWLVRQAAWPRIEARVPLPPAVQRLVEIYRESRPPGVESARLVIVDDAKNAPAGEPAIVLSRDPRGVAATTLPSEPVQVRPHPVTESIDWPNVMTSIPFARPAPSPAGWEPLVWGDGGAWVAVRDGAARQVWVGFPQAGPWAGREEFVYFWANCLDWVGRSRSEEYAFARVGPVDGNWVPVEDGPAAAGQTPALWPGLYRDAEGTLGAFNAPDVRIDPPPTTPWRDRLARHRSTARPGVELAPGLACAAVGSVLAAAILWKRRERRAPGVGGRHR